MACLYTYKGKQYTEDELIATLASDLFDNVSADSILRSISVRKPKTSDITSETLLMYNQRITDAKNMIQAVRNSNDSKEEKLKKTAFYKNLMQKTLAARKEFVESTMDKKSDFIINQAMADSKIVETLYKSDRLSFSELQFANSVVEAWENINLAFGVETEYDIADDDLRNKVTDVLNIYRPLSERTRQIAIRLISQSLRGGKVNEKEISRIVDTSTATLYTRELSTAGIPLSNKLAYIIKEVNFIINKEHNDNHNTIDKKYDALKNNATFKSMGWDLFVKTQKDKSGNETFGLVTRYSQNFWDTMRLVNKNRRDKIEKANGDKKLIKQAWKDYNDWTERNTVAFNAVPFLEMEKHTDAQRDAEVARMKSLGFQESEINDIIAESQKMYEKFQNNKEFYESSLLLEIADNPSIIPSTMTEDEYVKQKLEEYDDLNNPIKYLNQKFTKGSIVTAYGGSRYSYLIAAKEIDGKPTNYYDENFAKIVSDPELYDFYSWFVGMMKQNLSWLPQEEIEDLQSNFIPVIADRLAKEYGFQLKESVKGLGDWFMKLLTDNNYDQKVEKAAYSKKERRAFRSKFIKEDVKIEDRSKDLVHIAKLFSDMALIYKHKNSIKAEVDTINEVLQETKGTYAKNKRLGLYEYTEKDAKNIKTLADFTVRKSFYGIKSEDELWKSDTLFYDWKEIASLGIWKSQKSKDAKKLLDELKQIVNELDTNTNLTEKEIKALEEKYEEKKAQYYKLGGRSLSLTKAIDSSISGTRMTALGFAPFSAIRNILVGKTNNRIHARSGRDYSKADLIWANKNLISSTAKYWSAGKYETALTKTLFGLMADSQLAEGEDGMYLRTMVEKNTTLDKFREMLPKAYTWLSSGDYHFKAEMLLASMKHDKVYTSKGEFSFIDVLNEDRTLKDDVGEWDVEKNGGKTFEEFYRDKLLKYKQLANKLHGATGKDVNLYGKDTAIGRVLFLFKSWLPETVGVRFDPRHRDAILDRDEEGYYRTFLRIVAEKRLGVFKTILQTMFNKDNGLTDELDLANFKKAVYELQYITAVLMLYMLAKAMTPDDDKDKKMYNLLVTRQLNDFWRDLTYYSNINSLGDLQREVFPVIRTFRNWGSAAKAVTYHGLGVQNDQGEDMYDNERTLLKITKVLPVFSNINRVNYYMKAVNSSGMGGY